MGPLLACRKLRKLRAHGTPISTIEPLEQLRQIEGLDISTTKVSDLTPLQDHTSLSALNIANTRVSDLSPLAGCVSLVLDGRTRIGGPLTSVDTGLNFRGAPIADPHILTFAGNQRARTDATINYLRAQRGLPPLGEPLEVKGFDFSRLPERLPQTSFGAVFEQSDEHLRIARSGTETDLDVAANPVSQQLHAASQRKISNLKDYAARLANQRGWESFGPCVDRLHNSLAQSTEEAAGEIALLWAESVSLGSFLDQDDGLRADSNSFVEPLAPEVRRSLQDAIETLGPWLRRFPTARELDEESAAHRESESDISLALEILVDAKRSATITVADADLIAAALDSASRSQNQGKKAGLWGLASVRNITFAAISVVALGYGSQVGASIAERSALGARVQEFVLNSETQLVEFLRHLPSDIRAAVNSLLANLRPPPPKGT